MIAGLFGVAALFLCVWGLADMARAVGHLLMAVVHLVVCLWHLARR